VCGNAIKTSIEIWADFTGDRFRQRVRRDDGTAQEIVVLGPYEYPTARYNTNAAASPGQRCGAELPDASRSIAFMNSPRRSTNLMDYRERAKLVAGSYVDSRGRASNLFRESDTTGSEWFIDPATGDVQETAVSFLRPDGGRVRVTTTLVSDDEQDVADTFFDTAGLQLDPSFSTDRPAVSGDSTAPTIELGKYAIWTDPSGSKDPRVIGFRFARDVLKWNNPTITVEGDGGETVGVNVTIRNDAGHSVRMFVGPTQGGVRGVSGFNDSTMQVGAGPGGHAQLQVQPVEGTSRILLHVRRDDGLVTASTAPVAAGDAAFQLKGIEPRRISNVLALYVGPNDAVLGAAGGTFSQTDELHRSDPLVLVDRPKECAAGLAADFPMTITMRSRRTPPNSRTSSRRAAMMVRYWPSSKVGRSR
jgi:hypothetical protein